LLSNWLMVAALGSVPAVNRVPALADPKLRREVFLGVAFRAAAGAFGVVEQPGALVALAAPWRPAVGAEFSGEYDFGTVFHQVPVFLALKAPDVFESHFNFRLSREFAITVTVKANGIYLGGDTSAMHRSRASACLYLPLPLGIPEHLLTPCS
jgi:hypothetical protein